MQSLQSREPSPTVPKTQDSAFVHAAQYSALARLKRTKNGRDRPSSLSSTTHSPTHLASTSPPASSAIHPSTHIASNLASSSSSHRSTTSTATTKDTDNYDDDDSSSNDRRRSRFDEERPPSFAQFDNASSSSLSRTGSDLGRHNAFFDGPAPRRSFSDNTVEELGDFGFAPSHFGLQRVSNPNDFDDDEDLKDLNAIDFLRSIRMNIEALTHSSADEYAYSHDGYSDPNAAYHDKALTGSRDSMWMQNNYADLISRLSLAQDADDENHHDSHLGLPQRPFVQAQDGSERSTLKQFSSQDSSLAASLASGRSSSDALDDEARTPPESTFDAFESSMNHQQHRETTPRPPLEYTAEAPMPSWDAAQTSSDSSDEAAVEMSTAATHMSSSNHVTQSFMTRCDSTMGSGGCAVDDGQELELLSDDYGAQRVAAGKARMMPWQDESAAPSQSGHGHGSRRSSIYAVNMESNRPFTRLGPQDIAFSASTLPERAPAPADCIDAIVSCYPSICDAPLKMFGEDGQPLPPTKKQETSEAERKARRDALVVKFCAKQHLSLVKAMVVMESRNAHWRRIGALNPSNNKAVPTIFAQPQRDPSTPRRTNAVGPLPPMPNAWSLDIRHEQLDIAQIEGKVKKTIELASFRTNAECAKCHGSGVGACTTCKAEQADECFWCCGTGREKLRAQASCRRCQGAGVLKCNTCKGSLQSACRSCEGTGTGEYGFYVDVTVKRVEMPAIPLATLFPQLDAASGPVEPSYDDVKAAAKLALWDSITKLTEARRAGGKGKSKDLVPVMAACMWENSTTHVVSVDVPLAAKFKKDATPALRPEGLHRKIATQRRFFTVPTDEDLRPIELSEDQVRKVGAPESGVSPKSTQSSPSRSPPRSRSALTSSASSPATSLSDLTGSPPLATPEQGGGVSGFSTPTRVPSPHNEGVLVKPTPKEFVQRPSPLSQLAAATTTPVASSPLANGGDGEQNYFYPPPSAAPKARRPSAGQLLSKKFSSSLLNKLSSHRGSV